MVINENTFRESLLKNTSIAIGRWSFVELCVPYSFVVVAIDVY